MPFPNLYLLPCVYNLQGNACLYQIFNYSHLLDWTFFLELYYMAFSCCPGYNLLITRFYLKMINLVSRQIFKIYVKQLNCFTSISHFVCLLSSSLYDLSHSMYVLCIMHDKMFSWVFDTFVKKYFQDMVLFFYKWISDNSVVLAHSYWHQPTILNVLFGCYFEIYYY